MCYDVSSATRSLIKYATLRSNNAEYIKWLNDKLQQVQFGASPNYYMGGHSHPNLLSFTHESPNEPQLLRWGLIPRQTKTWEGAPKIYENAKIIQNQTLNAKIETLFEKYSFKNSAKDRRCIVYLDGMYEHYHVGKKVTFPFHIEMKNKEPFAVAGIWEEWKNPLNQEVLRTVSLITTTANPLMAKIHNNPELEDGPRMLAILPKERQDEWLQPFTGESTKKDLQELIKPYPAEEMVARSVGRIRGKAAVGNSPNARKLVTYMELQSEGFELFPSIQISD